MLRAIPIMERCKALRDKRKMLSAPAVNDALEDDCSNKLGMNESREQAVERRNRTTAARTHCRALASVYEEEGDS